MKKYLSIFRLRFSLGLQYRAAALAGISTQFFWGLMEILTFRAFYETAPEAFPMTFQATASYVWMQQAFLAFFAVWFMENEIFDSIINGNVAYELCRPISIYNLWFARSLANRISRAVLRCFPILVVAAFLPKPYGLCPPQSAAHFGLFLLTLMLGLAVTVAFCMLIYVLTFFTVSPAGLRMIFTSSVEFFAGAIIPLPFFPEKIQAVMELLPFAAMQNVALRIYSGSMTTPEMTKAVTLQIFWLAALIIAGKKLANMAEKGHPARRLISHEKNMILNALHLYGHYVSINVRSAMQYKTSFLLSTVGQFLVSFNVFLGIFFMFQRFHRVKGFTYSEVLLCFSIMLLEFSLAEMFARGFDAFSGMVRNATFDQVLVRPRNEILQVLGSKFELTRIGRMLQAVVLFCYGISHSQIDWSFTKVLTVIFMLLGGTALFTGIFLIYAALCFFTLEGLEFLNILTDGAREYGKYPVSIYGKRMLQITTFIIPYALVQYYPLLYLLGRKTSPGYIFVPLLAFLFLIPCYGIWRFGVRKYKSSGS